LYFYSNSSLYQVFLERRILIWYDILYFR
jgi:hypothetical protein